MQLVKFTNKENGSEVYFLPSSVAKITAANGLAKITVNHGGGVEEFTVQDDVAAVVEKINAALKA